MTVQYRLTSAAVVATIPSDREQWLRFRAAGWQPCLGVLPSWADGGDDPLPPALEWDTLVDEGLDTNPDHKLTLCASYGPRLVVDRAVLEAKLRPLVALDGTVLDPHPCVDHVGNGQYNAFRVRTAEGVDITHAVALALDHHAHSDPTADPVDYLHEEGVLVLGGWHGPDHGGQGDANPVEQVERWCDVVSEGVPGATQHQYTSTTLHYDGTGPLVMSSGTEWWLRSNPPGVTAYYPTNPDGTARRAGVPADLWPEAQQVSARLTEEQLEAWAVAEDQLGWGGQVERFHHQHGRLPATVAEYAHWLISDWTGYLTALFGGDQP